MQVTEEIIKELKNPKGLYIANVPANPSVLKIIDSTGKNVGVTLYSDKQRALEALHRLLTK